MTNKSELENLLYSTSRWLLDGGDTLPASFLLYCRLGSNEGRFFTLYGPRWIIEEIQSEKAKRVFEDKTTDTGYNYTETVYNEGNLYKKILDAFNKVYQSSNSITDFELKGFTFEAPSTDWRQELLGDIEKTSVKNQGRKFPNSKVTPKYWKGLLYRSDVEILIAQELDAHNVLFFPNCVAQLHYNQNSCQEEPDFLVCRAGRWGILEVDGPWHSGEKKAAQDHEKDRKFRVNGLKVVERYDWQRCQINPKEVVEEFLLILDNSRD